MMARHGNHALTQKFVSDSDVKRFFEAKGLYWGSLIETSRKPSEPIPIVENLIGSTWVVPSGRAAIVRNAATAQEEEITTLEGPGSLIASSYLQLFENSIDNLERCMERASFGDFQSCISNGIASIDAYITHRAIIYNHDHPDETLIDSKENKVSQDTKIDDWIPKMTNGKKLDKSTINWQNFKILRNERDNKAIHLKQPAISISYQQLGELLNLFRSGIAKLLTELHLLFNEKIPCKIIRYAYLPDIKLVETAD